MNRGHAARGVLFAFAVLLIGTAPAVRLRPVEGPIILERYGPTPEYLWNASVYVAHLVAEKVLGDEGMHALEGSAVAALAEKTKRSVARMVSIRVVYARTGAVSRVYNSATFVGMEAVCTITASRADLQKHASEWIAKIAEGDAPSGVKIEITGKLPPH